MNWLVWIIFGALAGWIASMIMGKNAQMGALANIVVGIVGAVIGGLSNDERIWRTGRDRLQHYQPDRRYYRRDRSAFPGRPGTALLTTHF